MQRKFFRIKLFLTLLFITIIFNTSDAQQNSLHENIQTDILIVGGGTSGVSAAIQAARLRMNVLVVEPTPWLLPFIDTTPGDWFFEPMQRLGISGVLKGGRNSIRMGQSNQNLS